MAKHATPSLTCPVNGCKIPVDAILVSAEGVRRGAHLTLLRTFDPELTVIKPEDRRQLAVAKLPERSHILGLLMKLSHNRPHTNLSTRSPDTIFELVGAAEKYWGISIDSDGHRSQGSKFPKFFGRSQAAEGLSELPRNVTSEKRPIFVQIWQVLGAKSEKFRRSQTASAPSEPRNPDGEVTGHRPSESIEIPQYGNNFAVLEACEAAMGELAKTSPENAARVMLYRASHGDYKSIDTLARRTMEIPLSDVFRLSKSYSEAYGTYTLYREHWHESMRSYNSTICRLKKQSGQRCYPANVLGDIFVAQVVDEEAPSMESITNASRVAEEALGLQENTFEWFYGDCYEALRNIIEGLPVWEDFI